ncbi:hypothetical protein EVAR_49398_1 [Eumeta japonica]|uniref:Uncharacterized protein n=1 Tax=Eumeta variegata TaxID=151549 RepID=A0A4C1YRD2_EUMVA|nr:hypothetical protein EVAR_49398_1 [Eumeta japonica]
MIVNTIARDLLERRYQNARRLADFFILEIINLLNVGGAGSRLRIDFSKPVLMATMPLERLGLQEMRESNGNAGRQMTPEQRAGDSGRRTKIPSPLQRIAFIPSIGNAGGFQNWMGGCCASNRLAGTYHRITSSGYQHFVNNNNTLVNTASQLNWFHLLTLYLHGYCLRFVQTPQHFHITTICFAPLQELQNSTGLD